MNNEKVTIFSSSNGIIGFGVRGVEAKLVRVGTADYAQYRDAPFVDYIPKGKRTTYRQRATYAPFMVIVRGWGLPVPPSGFNDAETVDGVTVKSSKYTSCDDRYKYDFNAWFSGQKFDVIFDKRHTLQQDHKEVA